MFTGLIEEKGAVAGTSPEGEARALKVKAAAVTEGMRRGDSVAINGVCQTVTRIERDCFTVFASPVTLSLTTLGSLMAGSPVNLERALTPSSRMGGHMVQGHVDATGVIASLSGDARGMALTVQAPGSVMRYVVERGSIAVDGISLTVVKVGKGSFDLYLIPETVESTIASTWKTGDRVNLETDILARYVENALAGRMNEDKAPDDEALLRKLREEGFA